MQKAVPLGPAFHSFSNAVSFGMGSQLQVFSQFDEAAAVLADPVACVAGGPPALITANGRQLAASTGDGLFSHGAGRAGRAGDVATPEPAPVRPPDLTGFEHARAQSLQFLEPIKLVLAGCSPPRSMDGWP